MKRSILLLLVVALFAGYPVLEAKDDATAPRKKAEKSMRLTDADNKKTVAVAAGTAFDIALKGNATTGFQWQVGKIEGEAIRQNGKVDYVPDKHPERMVGFGGTFIFHFTLTKAAKAKIRLVYVRPWEKDKPPVQTFEITIDPVGTTLPKFGPIVAASFTEGTEVVITPDLQKLKALGMTVEQLEPLRWQRLPSSEAKVWNVKIDGKTINLTNVATITVRNLDVKPFTVVLSDGREAIVTPDAKKVGRYLIPGWAFEEDVRARLSVASGTDPTNVHVLVDIPVPGGRVPNYWKRDRVHRSIGEPLEAFAKVEVRGKPRPASQTPKNTP